VKIDFALKLYLGLATAHSVLLVASNVAGAKLIALPFGLAASATVISYLCTYLIINVIVELYGRDGSALVVLLGLLGLVGSVLFIELAIYLPPADAWKDQRAFESTLGSSWRIVLGGWPTL
jgi:queuosine precursor transporter